MAGQQPLRDENVSLSLLDLVASFGKIEMANRMLEKGFKPSNMHAYYRSMKSFRFAYKNNFFPAPPKFYIFDTALKYQKEDIIRFLKFEGHDIVIHPDIVKKIGRGVRLLWKMGHKMQPVIDERSGDYIGDSEWLEQQWQKIAKGACGGNHTDMITLETIGEQFVRFNMPRGPPKCYPKRSLLQFMRANVFADWVQNVSGRPMDEMGYGGKPGKKRFVKTTDGLWFTMESLKLILRSAPSTNTFKVVVAIRNQRIGNLKGTFGISENHGQLPGFTIYSLKHASSRRVQSMRKILSMEATKTLLPRKRLTYKVQHRESASSYSKTTNPLFRRRPTGLTVQSARQLVRDGKTTWNVILKRAALQGNLDIIKDAKGQTMISPHMWDTIMVNAAEGGHMAIVRYAESNGANDWRWALLSAADAGHLDIVKYAGLRGGSVWNQAMYNAATKGHLDVVKYAASKGADNWNRVIIGATREGYLNIVKYAGSRGANNWRRVLNYARTRHHDDIVRYAEERLRG